MNDNQLVRHYSGLQPHSLPAPGDHTPPVTIDVPGPGLKRDYAGLLEYWQMVRRHRMAVLLATVLGALGGFSFTLSSPRIYQARTTIEIQGLNQEFLNMKNVNPVSDTASYDSDSEIQTQIKILQSRFMLQMRTPPRTRVDGPFRTRSFSLERCGQWAQRCS